MKRSYMLLFVLALASSCVHAQTGTPVTLTRGLIVKLPRPDANLIISPNAVVAAMETGSWKTPAEGASVVSAGAPVGTWRTIQADSNGWFNDTTLTNSYVSFIYTSEKEQTALVEASGNTMVYVNGSARAGNPYGFQDTYESWGPRFDYVFIPVKLKKGANELVFQCQRGTLKVRLHPGAHGFSFAVHDLTTPDLIVNEPSRTFGAIPIVNATEAAGKDLLLKTWTDGAAPEYFPVPAINPLSIQKSQFTITVPARTAAGPVKFNLALVKKNFTKEEILASSIIELNCVAQGDTRKETFISGIDGSVQYYAVNPPVNLKRKPALFLSLHGAGVEAINQAQAYSHKNWGYLVAATNRRPYGYNWENWGRLDALEVLAIAKAKFPIDENRVYLTGHSMGGHGTWQLGVHNADLFGAIGPSAGWISIWSYRIKPLADSTPTSSMLTRSTKPSDTFAFTRNLKSTGIYIIQGADDDNVPATQPKMIMENLATFHKDYVYYEEPGAGHWWDNSDEAGSDCVDWMPMFDFFAHHSVAHNDQVKTIDFTTANPSVSSKNYWIEVLRQTVQQKLSTIAVRCETFNRKFVGTTHNIEALAIDASMLGTDATVTVALDGQILPGIPVPADAKIYLQRRNNTWSVTAKPGPAMKNPARCGSFREAFNTKPVFVYGTNGNKQENLWAFEKARYDAERIWYRGNSSIAFITDTEFDEAKYADRSVILIGNSKTNSAWNTLLKDSPIQVTNRKITVGAREYTGDDYACLFIRPRAGSATASVAAIAATGIEGMRLAGMLQYFDQYLSFPDVVVFNSGILQSDVKGVRYSGYFGNDWSLNTGEFIIQ